MSHDEQQIQIDLVEWFHYQYPKVILTISPGGFITDGKTGSKVKRMGYCKGFPDISILKQKKKFGGLFLELKTEKGKVSPEQQIIMTNLIDNGYCALVAYGFQDAKEIIERYLND